MIVTCQQPLKIIKFVHFIVKSYRKLENLGLQSEAPNTTLVLRPRCNAPPTPPLNPALLEIC